MLVSHMGSIQGGILKAKNAYKLYIEATELVTVSVEFMLIHEVDFPCRWTRSVLPTKNQNSME